MFSYLDTMITYPQILIAGGLIFFLAGASDEDESSQFLSGAIGLFMIMLGLGVLKTAFLTLVLPALILLFGLLTMYSKGTTQLAYMAVTIFSFIYWIR